MKLAIIGKGGVGKTLRTVLLDKVFPEPGHSIIAINVNPDTKQAATPGFPDSRDIVPISEMRNLIEDSIDQCLYQTTPHFTLNPKVNNIPEKYAQ